MAGVLAADQVRFSQRPGGPRAQVAEVADRRGDDDERAPSLLAQLLTSSWSPTRRPQRSKAPQPARSTAAL